MHIYTMLVFWSLVRNSMVLAVYLLFSISCFFTVHEHFHNFSICKTGGSFLFLETSALPYFIFSHNHIISRLFQKWCSSGVVNAFFHCKIIDFKGFFGFLQDTAVADEEYPVHFRSPVLFSIGSV